MKAYEDHVAKNGQPSSHSEAKEIAAGFAGAFIDREVETRGVSGLQDLLKFCDTEILLPSLIIDELLRQGEGEARSEEEAQSTNRRPGLLSVAA